MKVRIRAPRPEDTKRHGRVCPCCERLNWKCRLADRVAFKEALEEISNTLDCEAV